MADRPALELLSRRLYEKMEHLCPTDDHCDWVRLSEKDEEYYRTLVENLLMADDLVEAALLEQRAANDDVIGRGA